MPTKHSHCNDCGNVFTSVSKGYGTSDGLFLCMRCFLKTDEGKEEALKHSKSKLVEVAKKHEEGHADEFGCALEREDFETDTMPQNIDTNQARCPHCGKEENDSWEITLDTDHDCKHCGRVFWVETEIVRKFTTYKMKPDRDIDADDITDN